MSHPSSALPPRPDAGAGPPLPSGGERILANTLFAGLARLLQLGAGLALLVLVARHLPLEDYGRFGYVSTLVAAVMAMTYFGIQQTVIKDMAREPERAAEHLGTGMVLRGGLCLLALAGLAAADLIDGASGDLLLATLLCGAGEACRSMAMLSGAVFQARRRMGWDPLLTLVQSLTALGLVWLALRMGMEEERRLLLVFAAVTASLVLQMLLSWLVCVRLFVRPRMPRDAAALRAMLGVAVVVGLGIFFNRSLVRVTTLLVQWLEGPEAVALFQMPHDFILRFGLAPQALMLAAFPVFAHLVRHDRGRAVELYRLIWRYTLLWGPILSLLLTLFATEIIVGLFGEKFLPAAPIFQLLCWAITPLAIDQLHVNLMVAMDRQRQATLYTAAVLLVCAGANWLVISLFDWRAAAVVAPGTYLLLAGVSTWFVRRHLAGPALGGLPWRLAPCLVAAWAAARLLHPLLPLPLALLATLAAYVACLLASGALPRRDMRMLLHFRRGRPGPRPQGIRP